MARNYTINTKIERPVADVWDAIVSCERLNRYFTNRSSGNLREGERIIWHWHEWGDFPVVVKRLVTNRRIELALDSKEWRKTTDDAYEVLVTLELEELDDGATRLSVSETGWRTDPEGLKASHDNCGGWTHMTLCLKAYIEHGIDLR